MGTDATHRSATQGVRANARGSFVVQAPSATAGVAKALRATYRVAGLPADLDRLLTKLN